EYLLVTGDESILDQSAGFVEAPPLAEDEHERYGVVEKNGSATLYDHCCLAVERTLRFGPHGLPLIGGGDWNDGMNLVGVRGRGESVWLGWFILVILRKFLPYMRRRGDEERARRWQELGEKILEAIERDGWDGAWYRRAYTDEGTALGSAAVEECRIDSLSQTWAVFCGEGDLERARLAMEQAKKFLWRRDERLFLLLAPPFDKGEVNPGYIRGYVPGVRENGGQYTHAAIWGAAALAILGEHKEAWRLMHDLSPVNHTRSAFECGHYRLEPYLLAADIYGGEHLGRGGWSGYTGAASWMHKVILEQLLGFEKRGDKLRLSPRLPEGAEFTLTYRYGSSKYVFRVKEGGGAKEIVLVDDGREHEIEV
ncbi:MAG: glycosyl transferase, partial [Clostridiales bacterium]|nr:glycosyl transferase [Clostridiales bacterium]